MASGYQFYHQLCTRIRFFRNDLPSKPVEDGEWDRMVLCNIPVDLLVKSSIRENPALKQIREVMFETKVYQPDRIQMALQQPRPQPL